VQTTNGIAFTVRYGYTLAGQLSSVTYPDGAVASYVRDAQGRTTQVNVQRVGAASEVLLNQASYAPFGPVAGWTYGNGRQLSRPLNQNYQPTAIHDAGTGGLSVGFAYDAVGNLTQLTPAGSSTPLVKFDYDALSRLTAFKDGPTEVAIESYAYDATGNRTTFTNASGTQAYTYPATSHRLSQVGATTRTYDNAGNTTAIGGTAKEFVYDDTGRMSQVKLNAVVQRSYAYNGKGEQVRKSLGTANTYTVYDEAGHWLGDYDTTGAALQQAIWLDDLPVGLIANGNQLHYVEPDHLGTPRVVIEVARNVPVWSWDLKSEAFGNSVPNQNPDGDANPLVFDMRFPGQRYDAASGLNQNGYRDYDPIGRYVESDPIGLHGGMSTYSYVMGTPVNAYDFYGLAPNCRMEAAPQTGWYSSGQTRKTTLRNQPLYIPVCVPLLPKFGSPGPEDFGPDPKQYMRTRKMLPSRSPPIPIEFTWKCKDLYYHKYILEAQELMDISNAYVCRDNCGNVTSRDFISPYKASRWVSQGEHWEIVSGPEYLVNE
ncbi:MAG: RHS repeat domain-containing protein, partial [Pseudoxanthomonas sp.]